MFGNVPEVAVSFAERIDTADTDVLQCPLVEREELPALPRDIQTGQTIVQQGIALRSSDIDLIWVHGYGFPPGKGGPMFYADHLGPQTIHDAMCKLHDAHGQMLAPAHLLTELAKTGKSFGAFS